MSKMNLMHKKGKKSYKMAEFVDVWSCFISVARKCKSLRKGYGDGDDTLLLYTISRKLLNEELFKGCGLGHRKLFLN